jgi:PAS domain S-box-containing protein
MPEPNTPRHKTTIIRTWLLGGPQSRLGDDPHSMEVLRRFILTRLVFGFGIAIFGVFWVLSAIAGSLAIAAGDFVLAAILLAASIHLKRTRNNRTNASIVSVVLAVFLLYLVASGGPDNSGHLWIYTYPLLMLFLAGIRVGATLVVLFTAALAAVLFVPGLYQQDHGLHFKLRVLGSYFAVSIVAFFSEYVREKMQASLVRKSADLSDALSRITHAEAALRQSEAKYRCVVERASEGIVILQNHRVLFVNLHFAALCGYTVDEVVGAEFAVYLCAGQTARVVDTYERGMGGEKLPQSYESAIRHRDGSSIAVEISGGLIDYDGASAELIVVRDIRARKRSEAERRTMEEKLLVAQKLEAVGRLAGGVAHDFNNILGAIAGYAEMIRLRFASDNPVLEKYVGRITEASMRAADVVAKLLAFARRGSATIAPVDMLSAVADVAKLLKHSVDKRICISEDIRASAKTVMGDRSRLQDALLAVALNGCDAMPEGGSLTLTVENTTFSAPAPVQGGDPLAPGTYLKVSVADTGVGMSTETKGRLFEPFFTTKEPGSGSGLGLASVYGTIRSHYGNVEIESQQGKGTAVTMYLPVEALPGEPAQSPAPAREATQGARILLVDDEDALRDMASDLLTSLGHGVTSCESGALALDLFGKTPGGFDLVILDMSMPGMSGADTLHALRGINPDVKFVLTSGYPPDDQTNALLARGGGGFLQKPFDLSRLSQTIGLVLSSDDAGPAAPSVA